MGRQTCQQTIDEQTPLITDAQNTEHISSTEYVNIVQGQVTKGIAHRLYISHFLSTWNSRVFEFGAILYLASVYPGTLLPMSGYALSRGMIAIVFVPAVGHFIDVGNRLRVVRVSIVVQRIAVAASCVIFYILATSFPMSHTINICLLVTLTLLACIEKLGSILNLVSVEKDWVVVVAGEDSEGLKTLNSQMRRIDLVCKLIGPLFIALIYGFSIKAAILVNLGMNLCSVVVEYFSIVKVYCKVGNLQKPKYSEPEFSNTHLERRGHLQRIYNRISTGCQQARQDLGLYFKHRVLLPSFAGALLHLTVLSFAGQMVTWLSSAGYSSTQIAITRTLSVMFEVLATWVAPWLMGRIGPVRAGLWLASWQIACLAAGMAIFLKFTSHPIISASGIVGGTILSRLGLRGFDLCAQIIVQEGVEAQVRGSFSSTEAAWQNLFEVCSFVSTMIFSRPDQFKYPTIISVIAVGIAGSLYAIFVRIQRGHLLHLPSIISPVYIQRSRERGLDNISSAPEF